MKQINLLFISDPGHGWLEVPESIFRELNIELSRFSYYSPIRKMIYAEEDCDAPKVSAALKAKGYQERTAHLYIENDCFVRRLNRL